jgi:hypothetical protein
VLSHDPLDIAACTTERRAPKLVVRVSVEAAYLHCAKAFMRSKLWEPASRVDRSTLPTSGKMISDQTGIEVARRRAKKWRSAMRRTSEQGLRLAM